MEKGFTLVELLAVIVILAIIALIAFPLVGGIIGDSKSESVEMSVKFYASAVEKSALSKETVGSPVKDGSYPVMNNGNVCLGILSNSICSGDVLSVELNGKKPSGGSIRIVNGKVVLVTNLKLENFYCNMDSNLNISISNNQIVGKAVTDSTKTTGNVPKGNFSVGDEYIINVDGTHEYHFIILSKNGDNINLIMTNNINLDGTMVSGTNYDVVKWASLEDYISSGGTTDSYNTGSMEVNGVQVIYGNNNKGPLSVINYLRNATSTWVNIPSFNETHNDEGEHYGIISFSGVSRIPYRSEVMSAGCSVSCPAWVTNQNYWLADSFSGVTNMASSIYNSNLLSHYVGASTGVRPVITIDKKLLT